MRTRGRPWSGRLAVHGTGVRNVEATPDGIAAQATNNVTVADARNETNTLNNGATDTADVDPSADLRLTKSHSGNFTHGQHGTYTLSVTNDGPAAAVGPLTVAAPCRPEGLHRLGQRGQRLGVRHG